MSRSAHSQGGIVPRELPKCSRCKIEFVLVYAQYENDRKGTYEWECTKCHKTVPKHFLREGETSEAEKFFSKKTQEIQEAKEEQRRSNSKAALLNDIRS